MKSKRYVVGPTLVLVGMFALLSGCDDEPASIGAGIFAALGEPIPAATDEQRLAFERGRQVAQRRFTEADGLGPDFNVVACANCHEKPVFGGSAGRYRDFLLVRRVLNDGSAIDVGVNGVQPQFTLAPGGRRPTDPGTNLEANRNPIPFFGVGLLAELDEAEILSRADEDDVDGDGVSGRPNFDRGFVGRFGRKAQTVSIEGFIRGPLFNHMGITSDPLSEEAKARLPVPSSAIIPPLAMADPQVWIEWVTAPLVSVAHAQVAASEEPNFDDDGVADPELSEDELFDLVSFAMLMAAPQPDSPTPASTRGLAAFEEVGCAACHIPAMNGPRGDVPAFTDLLLHDMGPDLDDGITMGIATTSEFRTQPLWGITATSPYLHDGRADTLHEAIDFHGGEATSARDGYLDLTEARRQDLIAFLESLGGSSQRSEGLVMPDAPILLAGTVGGPDATLDGAERELFLRGRAVFDRDVPRSEGLGERFNGDSCRACHFDPVIGGSGPSDVDVSRHGTLVQGEFTAPDQGTMAHRFSNNGSRPPIDDTANAFETRQPPPCFGLGFLESIPAADILALENCDDPDPTAISGCAHELADGSLGRLGWKANVPSLTEFARDAMANELGITLPQIQGQTFGVTEDDDGVADPEINEDDLNALVFYMRRLAPPPGLSTDGQAEEAGAELFEEVGCAGCHVTDFVTDQGIVAYTDLLLHQVATDGSVGIGDGEALPLEFRTPPLWGLSLTQPYMHDGRSFTLDASIRRHDAEALISREAYEDLSGAQRDDLLAFLRSL
ncbi:MAG: CxxC motif-containing protein (DUF1111 family) [Hyphomicrobiaceae bacterium]|jgi:CxxC motif-containing protein (DUF1111 family)